VVRKIGCGKHGMECERPLITDHFLYPLVFFLISIFRRRIF
jgi:hypothetical protein